MSGHGGVLSEDLIKAMPASVSKITQGVLLSFGIASMIISIAGEWSHGNHYLHQWLIENVTVMGCMLHLALILLVLFPGRIRYLNDEVEDHTVRAAIQCLNRFFIKAWNWIWVFFGLFYSVMFFRAMGPEQVSPVAFGYEGYKEVIREAVLMDVLNAGSTLFIGLIYAFMLPSFLRRYVKDVIKARKDRNRAAEEGVNDWTHHRAFWIPMTGTLLLTVMVVLGRMNVLYADDPVLQDLLLTLALGIASALVLAHFTGRMDSKFILNWQWVIVILFLYSAIQIYTSVMYEDEQINRAVFTYSAFTMKCVLFIFMSNFFESRRAIYYAVEIVQARNRSL